MKQENMHLLGYEYQSSEWYEASYKILNKDYEKKKINSKMKKTIIKNLNNFLNNLI